MLTILTIDKSIETNILKRAFNYFFRNNPNSEILNYGDFKIKHINFIQKNKKIPWKKIKNIANGDIDNLICDENISLPVEKGFNRYYSPIFKRRLCENAALVALNKANVRNIIITLYDVRAVYLDMPELLAPFCSELKIITNNVDIYESAIENLNKQHKTNIFISSSISNMYPSDVIVAPEKIKKSFKIDQNTVVFTSEKPIAPLNGIVYNDYNINIPNKFKDLKKFGLKNEYVFSALYAETNMYELGSLVPCSCISKGKRISFKKVCRNVKYILNEKYKTEDY